MSRDYLLGLLTLPALVAVGWVLFWARIIIPDEIDQRWGLSMNVWWRRNLEGISDYVLRQNIWWERSWGPFFAGCWYRERETTLATRWLGIGHPEGPCVIASHYRELDKEATDG